MATFGGGGGGGGHFSHSYSVSVYFFVPLFLHIVGSIRVRSLFLPGEERGLVSRTAAGNRAYAHRYKIDIY